MSHDPIWDVIRSTSTPGTVSNEVGSITLNADGTISVSGSYTNDLNADQGLFTNNGTGTLSLADSNGITLGKSNTNTLAIQGKQASSNGFIRFGSDSKYFGYNNSY